MSNLGRASIRLRTTSSTRRRRRSWRRSSSLGGRRGKVSFRSKNKSENIFPIKIIQIELPTDQRKMKKIHKKLKKQEVEEKKANPQLLPSFTIYCCCRCHLSVPVSPPHFNDCLQGAEPSEAGSTGPEKKESRGCEKDFMTQIFGLINDNWNGLMFRWESVGRMGQSWSARCWTSGTMWTRVRPT